MHKMRGGMDMIISEKQIMQLITIAHAHMANMMICNEHKRMSEIQDLLADINDQQSDELKQVE